MTEFAIPMNDVPNEFTKLDTSKLYLTRISKVEIGKTKEGSKNPGEPMIIVTLDVLKPEEWEGKQMREWLLLPIPPTPLDSTAERRRKLERGVRLRQFMEAAELKWGPQTFSTDDWVGAEVGCTVKNEENANGDVFSSVKKLVNATVAKEAIAKAGVGVDLDSSILAGSPAADQGI